MKRILMTLFLISSTAIAGSADIERIKKTTELQVKNLIEPVVNKYCNDQCKILAVDTTVDVQIPDEVAPGFEEVGGVTESRLAPSSAKIKLLMDEMIGPVSRGKLIELLQQHTDALSYPVYVETKIARFPQPAGASQKVANIKEKLAKEFQSNVNDIFQKFCPRQCMLADFEIELDQVNLEEAQYGSMGEFLQEDGIAVKIRNINGTILTDSTLTPEESNNILEMARLRTNTYKNVSLAMKTMKFPQGMEDWESMPVGLGRRGIASNSTSNSSTENKKHEKSETNASSSSQSTADNKTMNTTTENQSQNVSRFEKIERVESGDAVQKELKEFEFYALIFAVSVLALLIFIAMASLRGSGRSKGEEGSTFVTKFIKDFAKDPVDEKTSSVGEKELPKNAAERAALVAKRYEIERLHSELTQIFGEQPRVAKHVFSKVLTEEGVEMTANYIELFGEAIVVDMLRDPGLQSDLSELMEYYAKNTIELNDDDKLELLRAIHNRAVAAKMFLMGHRSTNLFDFLAEMDKLQILELIRNESMTVKAIVLTQVDPQKRSSIYSQLDEMTRMKLLTELSRIDHLPRDYIYNCANALKRKRQENPRLNTEALPGSDVLVSLLERTTLEVQKGVIKQLDATNPDSAHAVKTKLVSLDTLLFLRDNQLLEVVLSLKHDELLQFLKGAPDYVRTAIFSKSPKELVVELEEEMENIGQINRETYSAVARKILNRIKVMSNDGIINLVEVNERMFAPESNVAGAASDTAQIDDKTDNFRKVAGW